MSVYLSKRKKRLRVMGTMFDLCSYMLPALVFTAIIDYTLWYEWLV